MKNAAIIIVACLTITANTVLAIVTLTPQVRIVVEPNQPPPVHRAVSDLQRDLLKVLGQPSPVVASLNDVPSGTSAIVIVGPGWSDARLAVSSALAGTEAHAVYVARAGNVSHVVLHGSDKRGTIYAIYTFSEKCLGVPPLWLWASWTPQTKTQIELADDYEVRFGPPEVRWRGWFPNDQRQLAPWRARNQDNYNAYAETMLRLKLNVLDLGSFLNASFSAPYQLIGEAEMAKSYGLAVSATHIAPLGAPPTLDRWNNYWTRIRNANPPPVRSIYDKASLVSYWRYHVDAALHHDLEVVWPVGFRGGSDAAFWAGGDFEDPGTDALRAQVIREMMNEQIQLIKNQTGLRHPPMRVTLYNEMSDFAAAGLLDLPDEPSLINTFVAARRDHYPPPDLLGFNFRPDDLAGYYFNCQFTSTGSHIVQAEGPRKMEQNFRAVDEKSKTGVEFSVVNAGNIREHVMELSANAEMMWDFGAYDSTRFLENFSKLYFGQEHASEIAQFCRDYYAAYWQQMPPELPGFERQFIFQDLRLHRAMQTLSSELNKAAPNLNPFAAGDWFRIDLAANNADSQVEAVAFGLRQSINRLIPLTRTADRIYVSVSSSQRTFFNDNFRVQAYFLRHASEVVYYLAEAILAQRSQLADRRGHAIRLAAQAAEKMEAVLGEAEHDPFTGWYEPLRCIEMSSNFDLRERRNEISALLTSLNRVVVADDFEDGDRDGWVKIPDRASFTIRVDDGGPTDSIVQDPDAIVRGFHYVAWEAEHYDSLVVGNPLKSQWTVTQSSSGPSGLYVDSTHYCGSGYLFAAEKSYNQDGSNYVVYPIVFTAVGDYRLFVRAAAFDGSGIVAGADSLYLPVSAGGFLQSGSLPSEIVTGSGFIREDGMAGLSDQWVWYCVNKVIHVGADDLAENGRCSFTLKIGAREGGLSVDSIVLAASTGFGTLTVSDLDQLFIDGTQQRFAAAF